MVLPLVGAPQTLRCLRDAGRVANTWELLPKNQGPWYRPQMAGLLLCGHREKGSQLTETAIWQGLRIAPREMTRRHLVLLILCSKH